MSRQAQGKKPPEETPLAKTGWNLMVAGLLIVLSAGAAYYLTPRGIPGYHTLGNYLMGAGLAVYIAGRIIRARGRSLGRIVEGGRK